MKYLKIFCLFIIPQIAFSQTQAAKQKKEFSSMIDSYLSYTVPLITVEDLAEIKEDVILLDARELEEFEVSHIPGAFHVGYDKPNNKLMEELDKSKTVVVYCSIGYRSEKIGEILVEKGFRNVFNLYGSIFEWANQDKELENPQKEKTKQIHAYDKKWGKWMVNEKFTKVY